MGKNDNPDFLSELNATELKKFEAIRGLSVYSVGALLFSEGEHPRVVFIVRDGQIKLSVGSEGGRILMVQIASRGHVLGLTEVIAGQPYQMTAETLTLAHVAFVQRDDFLRFIREHPETYNRILERMNSDYAGIFRQIRILRMCGVPQKLARLLLDLADGNGGSRIVMHLTHTQIAELLGTARETVTRTMSDFRHRNWISIDRGTVTIRNRYALDETAEK